MLILKPNVETQRFIITCNSDHSRHDAGTKHASREDVPPDKVVLSGPRVRLPGSRHEVGGQG